MTVKEFDTLVTSHMAIAIVGGGGLCPSSLKVVGATAPLAPPPPSTATVFCSRNLIQFSYMQHKISEQLVQHNKLCFKNIFQETILICQGKGQEFHAAVEKLTFCMSFLAINTFLNRLLFFIINKIKATAITTFKTVQLSHMVRLLSSWIIPARYNATLHAWTTSPVCNFSSILS